MWTIIAIWEGWAIFAAIGSFVAGVATVFYTIFTYNLLSKTKDSIDIANTNKNIANKIAEFQIYTRISDDLSSNEASKLFEIIARNWFDIQEMIETETSIHSHPARDKILEKDLRKHILGPIEDMAKFEDDGIISMDAIETGFGSTVLMLGSNESLVNYIMHLRSKIYFNNRIYCGFEYLFCELLQRCSLEEQKNYTNYFKSNP